MLPVGVVACCKTKLQRRAAALDIYQGTLFRLSVAWLAPRTDGLCILSAKHRVLLPSQVIDPYELTLSGMDAASARAWELEANDDLKNMFPRRGFLAVVGKAYSGCFGGLEVRHAFSGLPIGRKMAAIKAAING